MSMKMMLLALALSAVGGGLVIAQDKQPPPPPQPAATSTAIEVVPIDIETPDPGWVRELAQLSLAGGEGVSWEFILTRVKFAGRYDQGLGFQPFMSPFAWRTEGVFPNKTWKEIFDSFASHTKTSWRIRGAHIDCMPQALLSHLQQSIDAGSLPTGDRTVWFAWMQRSLGSGMSVVVHPRLVASGWDDPANYRMRPGRTTVEAIIAGLAKSWGVSAYVMTAEQTVLIAARPTHRPMKPPVEIEQSYIVYNPPLPAIVDKEVSVSFEDLGMPQVVEQLTLLAGVPVKLDARAQDAPVVTLKVDRMKLRHVCAYIATISGTDAQYLDDHIFFAYDKVLVPKDATPHRDPDVMTPSKVSF